MSSPSPTPSVPSYTPPSGYVLVEERVYNLLLSGQSGAQERERAHIKDKTIYLEVLVPMHIGDIRTQINPGETIQWIPNKSVTIRGKVSNTLGSFLAIWNKQDPRSPRYDRNYNPVFRVKNPEDLETVLGPARRVVTRPLERDEDRIAREEGRNATRHHAPGLNIQQPPGRGQRQADLDLRSAPQPRPEHFPAAHQAPQDSQTNLDVEDQADYDDEFDEVSEEQTLDGLPPRGSAARRQLIHESSADRLATTTRRGTGLPVETETVENFPVEIGSRDSGRVVARVPGPSADENVIPPLSERSVRPVARRKMRR